MSSLAFLPTAATSHVEPGKYRATCRAIHQPELYRAFSRWYLRLDFAIRGDGSIVSKYLNLGTGKEPNTQLGPRSDYFKLWSMAVGREPKKGEPMDPAKIVGVEFLITVIQKQRHGGGEYSVVTELERLSDGGSSLNAQCSLLNNSVPHSSIAQSSGTQPLNAPVLSHSTSSGAQVRLRENTQSDNAAHMSTAVSSNAHNIRPACESQVSTSEQHVMRFPAPDVPPRFADCAEEYADAMQHSGIKYRDGRFYHTISGREISNAEGDNLVECRIQALRRRKEERR